MKSADIRIREVSLKDFREAIEDIKHSAFESPPALDPHAWMWAAFHGDDLVGFAGMKPSVRWERTGYLYLAAVAECARGLGLQRRFVRARIRKARSLSWGWLVTDTYENPRSANNLIACGFRSYLPTYPWACKGSAYWRLALE